MNKWSKNVIDFTEISTYIKLYMNFLNPKDMCSTSSLNMKMLYIEKVEKLEKL